MYRVNVSSVQDFMQCRFRWWCKWIMNRVPREEGPALGAGKVLHLIFEDHLLGRRTMEQAVRFRLDEAIAEGLPEKGQKIITDLAEALPLWKDKYHFSTPVLAVEEPFEMVLPQYPGIKWVGRPDREAVANNRVWHVQNRGLAASMNFGVYIELAKRHYHEHLYAEHLDLKYPDLEIGGTFFNLVRKLKYRTNVGKKNEMVKTPDEMFFQHPMPITLRGKSKGARLHRHVMDSLYQHVMDMQEVTERWERHEVIPAPNEKQNGGFSGNAIDPYFRVLVGEIGLEDDRYFKDREDTYAPVPADTGD